MFQRFLCGGRLIFGPDGGSLFFSTILILGPSVTFCSQVVPKICKLHPTDGFAALIVAITLTVLDLLFLFLTSSRDPGIVPRNSRPPESAETFEVATPSMEWENGRTPHLRLPRTKEVEVNGIPVRVKYCDTCMLYRPPRTSHCSICNNCVQKFDHHCPWVGQCIGLVKCELLWLAIIKTTYENFRSRYDKKDNPYDTGILRNIKEALFTKTPPSMNDFRSLVVDDAMEFGEIIPNEVKADSETRRAVQEVTNMLHPDILQDLENGGGVEQRDADHVMTGGEAAFLEDRFEHGSVSNRKKAADDNTQNHLV
ncbi:hypothetical protein ACLOJK_024884 [Asimina triloba]